jgi:hypothetical protein
MFLLYTIIALATAARMEEPANSMDYLSGAYDDPECRYPFED